MVGILDFGRLISNKVSVFLGADREQAAQNAANMTGNHPDAVSRNINPTWPLLEKFDNDTSAQSFSPYGGIFNPDYVWVQPTSDGQTAAFAVSSDGIAVNAGQSIGIVLELVAFADNAMEAKIDLFQDTSGTGSGPYVKVSPQPTGLDEFLLIAGSPNTPAVGLTETSPYNWEDIRVYSTNFFIPVPSSNSMFKIVASFEVTNYLIQPPGSPNPAGLQFMVDIYGVTD